MPNFKQPFVRMLIEDEEDADLWLGGSSTVRVSGHVSQAPRASIPCPRSTVLPRNGGMNNVLQVTSQKGLERFSSPETLASLVELKVPGAEQMLQDCASAHSEGVGDWLAVPGGQVSAPLPP